MWAALCGLLNISHAPTTAYHPQANGLVERFHRRLKAALRARLAGPDWHAHLPWVLLGLRSAPREDSASSPAEALYGLQLTLPAEFLGVPDHSPPPGFLGDVADALAGVPPRHNLSASQKQSLELPPALMSATMVFIRQDGRLPPLGPPYHGPYAVLGRSLRTFRIQVGDRVEVVSTSRLKPAFTTPAVQPAVPPRRGRPRKVQPPQTSPAAAAPLVPPRPPGPRRVSFLLVPHIISPSQQAAPPPLPRLRRDGRPTRNVRAPIYRHM